MTLYKNHMKVGDRIYENKATNTNKLKAAYNAAELLMKSGSSFLQMSESKFARMFFKILIVEYDRQMAHYIKKILKDCCGFSKICCVYSAEDAKTLIKKGDRFNLVISGYRLDENPDGYELYEEIKNLEKSPKFLMVTGASDYEVDNLKDAGISVLRKPFDIEQISKIVLCYYIKFLEPLLLQG